MPMHFKIKLLKIDQHGLLFLAHNENLYVLLFAEILCFYFMPMATLNFLWPMGKYDCIIQSSYITYCSILNSLMFYGIFLRLINLPFSLSKNIKGYINWKIFQKSKRCSDYL